MKTIIEKTFRVLGFTEEVTDCDCCGRSDLKGTIVLENIETGSIGYFGSVCGSKIAGNTKKYIETELMLVEKQNIEKARKEYLETPEKKAYDKHFVDREPLLTKAAEQNNECEYNLIIKHTLNLGQLARAVRDEICKKYYIKYSYKVGA